MADLLVRHELDEETVLRAEARCVEVIRRELCKPMMEQVELDVLLIEDQSLKHPPAIERP